MTLERETEIEDRFKLPVDSAVPANEAASLGGCSCRGGELNGMCGEDNENYHQMDKRFGISIQESTGLG